MLKLRDIFTNILLLFLVVLLLTSCTFKEGNSDLTKEIIVFTAVPTVNSFTLDKFPEKSRIFKIVDNKSEPIFLTESFYSARSPEISFDGNRMLFTAQKNDGDIWQIWEMDLESYSTIQITSRSFNCTDPAYLPDGRIVFSSQADKIKGLVGVVALFTIKKDGTKETQITFHPSVDQNPTVLGDGRILANTHQVYPEKNKAMQLVLRPDGTKAEMFYKPVFGVILVSRGWETEDDHYVYIEQAMTGQSHVFSINQNRPFNSAVNLSIDYSGEFNSVFPDVINQYLVSYRKDREHNFSIYRMIQGVEKLALIYESNEYHLTEPVVVKTRLIPKKLPSRIVEDDAMGIILCMDADLSQDTLLVDSKTSMVEVFGIDASLGRVPVSKDGSFYIKVPSNTPVRFQTFDLAGEAIHSPSAWIWVRPNERRGCIGCHENKELTPENKVPLAVSEKPRYLLDYLENSISEKE